MKKLIKEQVEQEIDEKVIDILSTLRDEKFGNAQTRKRFASLIVSLAMSGDKTARLAIKRLGNYFTSLGEELLGEPVQKQEESKMRRYKRLFEN